MCFSILHTKALDSTLESWILTTLSLITNKDSNPGMNNLIQCKGETIAIHIHRLPTFGTKSSSSNNSIFNWLDKNRRKKYLCWCLAIVG
jgi:hypothetical protein